MSRSNPPQDPRSEDDAEDLLAAEDAAEEILQDDDQPMGDDDEDEDADQAEDELHEEIQLQNDSAAHFDSHTDSVFCLAQHPTLPSYILTGGGDDCAYLFDSSLAEPAPGPVLPASYETKPTPTTERTSIAALQRLDGHTDSVNAVAFTQPSGDYVVTAGLDGKLRVWSSSEPSKSSLPTYTFLSESSEVQEINWLSTCPSSSHPNTIALGASDGSVWVYIIDGRDTASPLSIIQAYYLHTESCTAGSWTPDGNLLATVSEDSSFLVYDVWGEAANAGAAPPTSGSGKAIISLNASDQRFAVEGGLYSIAISPGGTIAAVGGAGGQIRTVSLPRLVNALSKATTPNLSSARNAKKPPPPTTAAAASTNTSATAATQSGTLLACLSSQSDSIETLSFSPPPLALLASGSVDGSIALFDVSRRFALRRQIRDAHAGFAVVQLAFLGPSSSSSSSSAINEPSKRDRSYHFTSAGMDGVVRRWDGRGGTVPGSNASAPTTGSTTESGGDRDQGLLVGEWKGHRGDGEGGGVLAFVQGERDGESIVTAGDDGVVLVFRAEF